MKKILIIGASSAIAERCARLWAAQKDELYLVARNEERIQTIASDLRLRGASRVTTYCIDINELNHHEIFLKQAISLMKKIDIALIAHGSLSNQHSCENSVKKTLDEIKTNALSTISLLTLLAKIFEKNRSGTIAVISSVAGERGRASNYVYGSAKAMITAFTSGLRQRLYKSNVNILTIKPGFVDTPMTSDLKKRIFWVSPEYVAKKIINSINKHNTEVYIPAFWWLIMLIIKNIPVKIFKRLEF